MQTNFDELVSEALDSLPDDISSLMSNVAVVIEDEPPAGLPLLGLYSGVPLTRRTSWYGAVPPDKITIYQGPIERHFGHERRAAPPAGAEGCRPRDRSPFRDQR